MTRVQEITPDKRNISTQNPAIQEFDNWQLTPRFILNRFFSNTSIRQNFVVLIYVIVLIKTLLESHGCLLFNEYKLVSRYF